MSAIRKIIQRQLFQKDDERIQAIVNVSELDGKKKKNQTLLCLAVTIEHPIAVRLYFVKGEKDDTFKKIDRFSLRDVREVDGINPEKPSPEFHITIGDRQYVILADSAEEKEDFIRELYKLSCQYLPVQMPDFCNFSLPQLEAEASIISIELLEHDIAMMSDYQPVSQKEDADFRKLIEEADLTIRHAHLSAEMLLKQLQSLDGANINSMMDSENSVNQLLSSIDAVLNGVESVGKELDRCEDILAFVRNSIEIIEEKDKLSVVERKNEQRLNDENITFVKSLEVVTDAHIETLKQANFSYPESSTRPKNLSDMPLDVVGLIIDRSDYKEQLILRKTSKSLRELVGKQKPACTRLEVCYMVECIICKYNDHCVAYVSLDWEDDWIDDMPKNTDYRMSTIISRVDYHQVAFNDLALTLNNPKLQLEYFSFLDWCKCCHEERTSSLEELYGDQDDENGEPDCEYGSMEDVLKSINPKISVKECKIEITDISHATSILPHLKPGALEKIAFFRKEKIYLRKRPIDTEAMEQIALLDQWKQAKELIMECAFDEDFPVEHFIRFKRFQFVEEFAKLETWDLLFGCLMEPENGNVEFCSVLASYPEDILDYYVGTPVAPNLYHYTTPDLEYYLEFMVRDYVITIEKKNKQIF